MSSRKGKPVHHPSRLGKWLSLLPTGCILLYPLFLAAQLDLCTHEYHHAALPPAFQGLRIAYISDIHYGSYFSEDRLQKLVERVNALEADVILLGGDYAEDSESALAFWKKKPAFRAKTAVLGVLGNHDRTPPEENFALIQNAMKAAGVIPLVNDVYLLEKEGQTLAIAGVDDYYNGFPDVKKAAELSKAAPFTIFLSHSPDIFPEVYETFDTPFYQLALCGHTHGGQVAFFGWAPKPSSDLGNRYRSGWFHEKGTDILVSNGVGTSLLPVRLGARPQFHLITLQRK